MKIVKCSVHGIYPKWDDVGNRFYCPTCNLMLFAELQPQATKKWNEENGSTFQSPYTVVVCSRCGHAHQSLSDVGERSQCPNCEFFTLREE